MSPLGSCINILYPHTPLVPTLGCYSIYYSIYIFWTPNTLAHPWTFICFFCFCYSIKTNKQYCTPSHFPLDLPPILQVLMFLLQQYFWTPQPTLDLPKPPPICFPNKDYLKKCVTMVTYTQTQFKFNIDILFIFPSLFNSFKSISYTV